MEYCAGGSLTDIINIGHTYTLDELQAIVYCMASGIAALHSLKIIHRDIKGANVLLSNNLIKLADYGVSSLLESGKATVHTKTGTPYWMAPQY